MKVVVDFDVCASTGTCTNVAPQIFEIRSDGYLYILNDYESHLPDDLVERAREAAELCPTGAISIEDDDEGSKPDAPGAAPQDAPASDTSA